MQSVSFIDLGSPSSGAIYELPETDPLVAPPAGLTQFTPDQIHVTLGGQHPHPSFSYFPRQTLPLLLFSTHLDT